MADPHPLAIPGNHSSTMGVNAGDRFVYLIDGRRGRLDEATHDGDALVTWDNGAYDTIKWAHIRPEPRDG